MHRRTAFLLFSSLTTLLIAAIAAEAGPQPAKGSPRAHKACVLSAIACGQTVFGELEPSDCALDDGSFADFHEFPGTAGQTVTVTMTSGSVDAYLFLLDPNDSVIGEDDDGAGGTNARISNVTLNVSGSFAIVANSLTGGETGPYSVTLQCQGPGVPSAPPSNLAVTSVSANQVALSWTDNSSDETGFEVQVQGGSGLWEVVGTTGPNVTAATVFNLLPGTTYLFRVRALGVANPAAFSNTVSVTTSGGPTEPEPEEPAPTCQPSATALCLGNGRFRVEATFQVAGQPTGQARVVKLTDETGYFWFFDASNVEAVVKVLNACPLNNRFWVFAGGLTNVRTVITVTDTVKGAQKTYINPQGTPFQPIQDTDALATCP